MKLDELHTDYLWEGEIEGEPYALTVTVSEGLASFMFGSNAKKSTKLAKAALKSDQKSYFNNPATVALAAGVVMSAISKYRQAKRNTIQFYASGVREKKLYKKMIDDLMKTGSYKIIKEKPSQGGKLWVVALKASA